MSIFKRLQEKWARRSSSAYIKYLRNLGLNIGDNVIIYGSLKNTIIDKTRPSLVTIGNNVLMNRNFSLFTHDFVSGVFRNKYHDFIPSSGPVKIGNNVRFGVNCTVLKGVTIGDNCFIAAGSLVTKSIPENSIAGGVPAKVICTLDAYHEKRLQLCIEESFIYARSILERFNRIPVISDFKEEFPLFIDSSNIEDFDKNLIIKQLGGIKNYNIWIKQHKATFKNFSEFLEAAGIKQ